jgi:hypothetical protein
MQLSRRQRGFGEQGEGKMVRRGVIQRGLGRDVGEERGVEEDGEEKRGIKTRAQDNHKRYRAESYRVFDLQWERELQQDKAGWIIMDESWSWLHRSEQAKPRQTKNATA